jgi:hypothetical protein
MTQPTQLSEGAASAAPSLESGVDAEYQDPEWQDEEAQRPSITLRH